MKIECAFLETEIFDFWQGKKAENVVFYFDVGIRGIIRFWLFYCQIQTTKLIMFFSLFSIETNLASEASWRPQASWDIITRRRNLSLSQSAIKSC